MTQLRKSDYLANSLMGRIVRGEIGVGTLLPKENELAEEYGVTRSVVRDAIKLLEVHHLVEPRRRRGTEVLDPNGALTPEVIRAVLIPSAGELDTRALMDLLEVRATLDSEMTGLAAQRRSDTDLEAMTTCLEKLRAHSDSPEACSAAIDDLTLCIANATGNRIYVMMTHWHRRVFLQLGLSGAARMPDQPQIEALHYLVDLIRNRDAEAAREAIRRFHEWATPQLLAEAQRTADSVPPNKLEAATVV